MDAVNKGNRQCRRDAATPNWLQDLYADRTSAHTMRANQLRLWLASFAYMLMCALRRLGLVRKAPRCLGLARPKQSATVLVTVKDKSLRDGEPDGPPSLTVTARGGDHESRSGRGDGRQSAEQGDEKRK